MSVYTKLACFVGGALFGSFGVKLLASKDAKKSLCSCNCGRSADERYSYGNCNQCTGKCR